MDDKSTISDVLEAEQSVQDKFQTEWEQAYDNQQFASLRQWTLDESGAIKKQGRIPYVMDKMIHPISILLGTQRNTRFDINFLEQESSDYTRTEVLNAVWKYFAQLNHFIHVESDIYQDGIVSKYGVFESYTDYKKNPLGDLIVRRKPFDQVMWDKNFRNYDLSDANWMSCMDFIRRDELKRFYPDQKELIDLAGVDNSVFASTKLDPELWSKPEKGLVGVRNFYQRDWKTKYFIWEKGQPIPEDQPYETKEEAEAELQKRVQIVLAAAMSGQQINEVPDWDVLDIEVPIVTKRVIMINGVLEEPQEFPLGDFPYSVYFAYFNDGEYWTTVERLKDPQRFYNRMYSHIDHWIGTMAKGLINLNKKETSDTVKDVTEKFGKTGGVVQTNFEIKQIESKGPAPQMFSVVDRIEQLIQDSLGGANIMGIKETASESGRAVLARQAQAGLDNFVTLDNFRRTKQLLGSKIAWHLTHEISTPRKLRIIGDKLAIEAMQKGGILEPSDRPNMGYATINTQPQNTISNLEVDVVVDEAQHSITHNQAILGQIADAFKSGMITVPPPLDAILEMMGLPESVKQSWLANAQPPKEDPMKISAGYKDLPPSAQATLLKEKGLPGSIQEVGRKAVFDKLQPEKPEKPSGTNKG
jgi:hypothetical protein